MATPFLKNKNVTRLIVAIIKTARPRQWLKSFAVFAEIIFSGQLLIESKFVSVVIAFLIFSGLSSAMYFLNDVADAEKDRLHPFKKRRPIAAGELSSKLAILISLLLIFPLLAFSFSIGPFFGGIVATFVLLQASYTLYLKKIILIDVMTIAATFLLRVWGGAVIIDAHVTVWFLLAVSSLALFLAVGKRRSERTILSGELAGQHRSTLSHYPDTLLDALTIMFATAAWMTYTMFTFLEPIPSLSPTVLVFLGELLPRTFTASKWLMISVPFVIYGVMRYLYIIYEKREGESPERVLLSDKPLLIAVSLWGLIVFGVIYAFQLSLFTNFLG
ncbi:MAG TPA: UbiA prenyltransferase family protein [Patescibacteria group bacterium]